MIDKTVAIPGPHDVFRRELPNGIVVLVRENPHVQSVVLTGSLNAGSLFEPPGQEGLASFVASMLMRGAGQRDYLTIHEMLEGCGAELSFGGGRHTVGFSGRSLDEDLPMLIELLADALRQPAFPAEHVERLRGQMITGLKIREQDTSYVANRLFRELVYTPDHPYGRSIDGTVETISTITRDQLVEFRARHYGPREMFIVIVGAVAPEDAIGLVEEHLGDWANDDQPKSPELPPVEPLESATIKATTLPDKSQTDLVLGNLGPSRCDDDWQAANLANNILGVFGMYGRIGARVREKQGMAYYSYSQLNGGLGPGTWKVVAGVNPTNVTETVETIRDEIRRFLEEPLDEAELADSKANFIGRVPLQLESNEGVAGALLLIERYQLGLDYLQNYADIINKLTAEEVQVTARRYLDPDRYVLAMAGPEGSDHAK